MSRLSSVVKSATRFKTTNHYFMRTISNDRKLENHYEVLDIARGSSQSEIKDAYYKLSKQYHPDRNPGDDNASDKFRKITEAYDILSNEGSKQEYDRSLVTKETGSSPFKSNYRPPPFRDANNKSVKPLDSEDYTQFYKNRRAQLGRHDQPISAFNINVESSEQINKPFEVKLDPQTPPIETKKYKYYSATSWREYDSGESDPKSSDEGQGSFFNTFLIFLGVAMLLNYASQFNQKPKYCAPPKS